MKHLNNNYGRLLILTALILLLAACSGSADTPTPTNTPVPAEPTAEPQQVVTSEAAVQEDNTAETQTSSDTEITSITANTAETTTTKLNLNQATGNDYLAAIPDFSSRMVREFLEYKPYISIQQFRREIGKYVDDDSVAYYEQYVYVPIDVDEADAETLQQIPGLDSSTADALIAARPYGSNDAFLAKLAELAPTVDATAAASLLSQ